MLHDLLPNYAGSKGINCAEGTLLAANEYYDLKLDGQAVHLISAFGGGCGCGRLCGALAGALAALGAMELREQGLSYNHQSPTLRDDAAKLTERFVARYGTEQCVGIRPQVQEMEGGCETVRAAACDLLEQVWAELHAQPTGQ